MEGSVVTTAPDTTARKNAKSMTGWMKFIGIMTIIGGALNALSIVGLLWAWIPIWLGIVMVQAGSRAGEYADKGDMASLEGLTGRLKTYFTLSGIMLIIVLAVSVLAGIIGAVLLAAGVLSMPNLMEYFNR
jgi:ABC-type Na+ efflux pump permease subunit